MSTPEEQPTSRASQTDRAAVEDLVASCIEALERGDTSPTERICAERPDLLTRVQKRLAQLAQRGLIPTTDPLQPSSIGPYVVLKTLGSGGMGTVYLAEQRAPVRRHVALKVVKLGMDTREVVARFQGERQALALMNHPNIAQVFEAGITAEGRPFFAMEYVDGPSLTSICDHRSLGVDARIRLFATVCRAVQHAHDRGFIHRDLKPTNILVVEHEGTLVPKVIDFGIAKATALAAADAATQAEDLRTRADQILGTPEYMSPEQATTGGIDVDARSDVYSLGVTLYELLCGELPFDSTRLRRAPRREMERILLDELPTLPSKRLSLVGGEVLAARGGERTTVQRAVSGELDWITLRALAKSREHRYPSPLALAEDLERWLRHEPVLAAPPGRTYRLRKFVRRHRVAVAAVAMVLLSLIGGLVVSLRATWRAQAAQRAEARALASMRSFYAVSRDAIGGLVTVADERLADVPQAEAVRRQMLADAMRYYESLRERQPEDLALRVDIAMATERIGTLQQRLGQLEDAAATLRAADAEVVSLRGLVRDDVRLDGLTISTPAALARALALLGQRDAGREATERALAAVAAVRVAGNAPGLRIEGIEAALLANLGLATDDNIAATALFERAVQVSTAIAVPDAKERAERANFRLLHAESLTRLGRLDEAAEVLGVAAMEVVDDDHGEPTQAVARRELLARVQSRLADVLRRLGRGDEAKVAQQRSLDLYLALAAEHPDVPSHLDSAAAGWHFLAQLAQARGEMGEAIDDMGRAVAIRERLAENQPQDYRLRMRSVRSQLSKANIEIEAWQHHGAPLAPVEATLAKAVERVAELHAGHGDDAEVMATFAAVHQARAALRNARGDHRGAIREYETVREALSARLPKWDHEVEVHYQLAMLENNLLQAHFMAGDPSAAAAHGETAMRHLERGLELDARSLALLELAPTVAARVATAQFAAGNEDAGYAAYVALLDRPEWGPDAAALAAMLLSQQLRAADDQRREALLPRVVAALVASIEQRGELAVVMARPPQSTGISTPASRLRDLDLRLVLAEVPEQYRDGLDRARLLLEAQQLADSIDGLEASRQRNVAALCAEHALAEDRAADAVAIVEHLLDRIGPAGGGCYMAAVLLAQASAGLSEAAAKEAAAARSVELLRHAVEVGEVPPAAVGSDSFAALRGRADYAALQRL